MMQLSRLQLYGLGSSVVTLYAIMNAFRQRSNFYSASVHLSHSNACVMILWNQAIYQTVLFGKLIQKIFFGPLRLIEIERLQERGWFAITETLLALTIFKDDFESSFVIMFLSLLFLKVFHWLASDRVEMMEQSARVSRLAHFRMISLLSVLWTADVLLLVYSVESILIEGPTVMIMFASEYMILIASVWVLTMKYIFNCIDLRSDQPWEEKSLYGLYVDLTADFFKLVTYLAFFCLILTFYGLPLNILRDVYITLRSFVLKVRDLRRYRQATRNMDTLYPDASLEEMQAMADKTCIICREDMEFRGPTPPPTVAGDTAPTDGAAVPVEPVPAPAAAAAPRQGPNDTPKKLPCGHVFHFHCLRSWLERQQSCPTCRRTVLTQPPATPNAVGARAENAAARAPPAPGAGPAPPNGEEAIRQAQINLARNMGRETFGVIFPNVPFPPEALQPATPAVPTPTAPPGHSAERSQASGSSSLLPPPGPLAASPPLDAANDNPLARFNISELDLPMSDSMGLYPTTAFGGFNQGPSYSAYLPGLAAGRGLPNLEERLALIRRRKIAADAAAAAATAATSTSSTTLTPTPTINEPKAEEKKKEEDGDKKEMSAREAALAAAERRAAKSRATPRPVSPAGSTSSTVKAEETASPSSTAERSDTKATSRNTTSTRPTQPRLIPLIDSTTSPTPISAYPSLSSLPSDSLFPPAPTPEQLSELSTLTRGAIEERLRLLTRWSGQIEGMVKEMRGVLDVLPPSRAVLSQSSASELSATPGADLQEKEAGNLGDEKGKQPIEGLNAQ